MAVYYICSNTDIDSVYRWWCRSVFTCHVEVNESVCERALLFLQCVVEGWMVHDGEW